MRVFGISLITVFVLLAGAGMAETTQAASVAGVLPATHPDSLMVLLPPRAADAVNQDLALAGTAQTDRDAELVAAQSRVGEAKANVKVCESEIETIKAMIKLAKERKDKTEEANLAQKQKTKERQLEMLKARKDLRDAETSLAEARRAMAQAQAGFYRKELELIEKRMALQEQSGMAVGTNLDALLRLQREIRNLERRCLEILKDVADKEKKAAEDEGNVVDKRLKVLQTQLAYFGGSDK
ncbi:MAG: hypothetical protein KBD56_05570 [Candidatus Eisenbacteria bacterium]|nr:hypothetical protein [Candidatus Eisenbacteria bacterium]